MAQTVHGTLVADTVTTVNLGQDANTVEVVNRNGVGEIYFRVDGVDPTVAGEDSFVVPATISATTVQTRGIGNVEVRLISSAAATFSVMADI